MTPISPEVAAGAMVAQAAASPGSERLTAWTFVACAYGPARMAPLFGMARLQAAVRVAREQGAEIGGGDV